MQISAILDTHLLVMSEWQIVSIFLLSNDVCQLVISCFCFIDNSLEHNKLSNLIYISFLQQVSNQKRICTKLSKTLLDL